MNVYEASQLRLKNMFDEFDNICVSFSGGKDSGVLLNLVLDYIKDNKLNRKISLFHIDYEAQYQMTTDYVDSIYNENSELIDYYRICLPISAQCSTSMYSDFWTPWDEDKKDIWVRKMPEKSVNETNHEFDFFYKGISDYDFQNKFAKWIHKKNNSKKTASLIGIRTQESLHRWKAIHKERVKDTNYLNWNWTTKTHENVYNLYPIFDWKTEDIWEANNKFNWTYNKLYDLFYQAGLTINQMRVASPFNDCAQESLKLYKVIDPNSWGKMVGRVNGVNFTGIYGGTTAMGWRTITLPKGHTWKSYMEFLLETLPDEISNNYKKKLNTSVNFWENKGAEVSQETVIELKKQTELISVSEISDVTNRVKIRMKYLDDIDLKEFRLIPTYKRMTICILKNDHSCKFMGFGQNKSEMQIRRNAELKYKNIK